jgi:hypothetical protein
VPQALSQAPCAEAAVAVAAAAAAPAAAVPALGMLGLVTAAFAASAAALTAAPAAAVLCLPWEQRLLGCAGLKANAHSTQNILSTHCHQLISATCISWQLNP